jgi:predicted nucleotidyltransferase component of viral defense system
LSRSKLNEIQTRVLGTLAHLDPPFILSGGGALAGIHLGHRTTRDLDLFWRNRARLGDVPDAVAQQLQEAGLTVATLQRGPAFVKLRVSDQRSVVVVDLIAEATDSIEPPTLHPVGSADILVDSTRAILAEKLCALLERSEIRDLVDVEALLRSGESLEQAIADAPRRDSGFSPLTLAWVLRDFDVRALASTTGLDDAAAAELETFRVELIGQLLDLGKPQ